MKLGLRLLNVRDPRRKPTGDFVYGAHDLAPENKNKTRQSAKHRSYGDDLVGAAIKKHFVSLAEGLG
jgi:hypothetical protein